MTVAEKIAVFNGTHTIRNRETGEYRTFRVRTQKDDAKFAPGKRVLSLLTGSDNEASYTGFAFVEEDDIKVWRSKTGEEKWSNFDWFADMLFDLAANDGKKYGDKYEIMTEGRCIVCNRKLTTPESIETGIGPVCAGRGR